MKKVYITFSGNLYDKTTKIIVEDGLKYGADEVRVYDDKWLLTQPFYEQNKWLWNHSHKRGFGWYCWKPFIVYHALQNLEDGDIVMFTDADCYPINDFSILYEQCNKDGGIMLFSNAHQHSKWCKRDCYIVMAQDNAKYHNIQQGCARFMLFQKGKWKAIQFLMEWLTYCVNPRATTFDPSALAEELPGMIEHRCEQAIMTNLAYKYDVKLYREADQHGNFRNEYKDLYPQLFVQDNPSDTPGNLKVTLEPTGSIYANVKQ